MCVISLIVCCICFPMHDVCHFLKFWILSSSLQFCWFLFIYFLFQKTILVNFLTFCIFFFHSNEVAICEVQFFIRPLTKNIHTSPKNYFGPSKIFPTYYSTQALTNIPHIITQLGPTQILLIPLPKLDHKIISSL